MTRRTNARIAGLTFLLYIAAGVGSMVISGTGGGSAGTAERLAQIAAHLLNLRITILLDLVQVSCALVLGVTLYALTRDEDRDLAILAMTCRVCEAVVGLIGLPRTVGLLRFVTAGVPDSTETNTLGAYLLLPSDTATISATFFAVGSTLFSWLLLRGRLIPAPLAALGLFASVLLLVGLPLQLVGLLHGPATGYLWAPMAAFEVPLAGWLLVKGVGEHHVD